MKITYTSFDGKEFCSEEECLAYEREVDKKEYHKDFVEGPLKKRADFVMDAFLNASRTHYETDEVLEKKGKDTRYSGATFCGYFYYGITYLRDDAVDILIDYIRILENEVHRLENELENKHESK